MQKTVLIISFSDLGDDARVRRQICAVKDDYKVTTAALGPSKLDGVQHISLQPQRLKKGSLVVRALRFVMKVFAAVTYNYEAYLWMMKKLKLGYSQLKHEKADLIIANDLHALPLAARLKQERPGTKLYYDAHEYSPLQFEDRIFWRFLQYPFRTHILTKYLKFVDHMTTVCDGISEKYEHVFGIKSDVITNAGDYCDVMPGAVESRIKVVHHGLAGPSRKIENIIKICGRLDDRFDLDLFLVRGPAWYRKKLRDLASKYSNVTIKEPVSQTALISTLNKYDLSMIFFEDTTFNLRFTLPNKLFESIQARLGIVTGPSIEIQRFVEQYKCGIVLQSFAIEDAVAAMRRIDTREIMEWKKSAGIAAANANSRENLLRIKAHVDELLGR